MYLAKLYKDINYLDNMKKILLFTSILFLTISTSLFAQHPTNLVASNITSSSVNLSWDASVCGGNVHLRYKENTASNTMWTDVLNVPNNPYLLGSLLPNTIYNWSVKCAGTTGWAAADTFTTLIYGPSISNVVIIDSIACFDSTASIQISINQTTAEDTFKLIVGQMVGSYFVSFSPFPNTTSTSVTLPNFDAGDWVVRIVDSIPYYTNNIGGSGPSTVGIYSEWNLIITEPNLLVASTTPIESNQCAADCIATEELTITGGTQPYNYTLDTDPTVILGPQSYDIVTVGTSFSPNSLTINVGDTVTWTNTAGSHNINATLGTYSGNPEGFGNGVAADPWSFQWIFTIPGAYDYQCDPHVGAGMTGVVIVNPSPSNTSIDTLINLCEATYNLVVSDANGCLTSPSPTAFTIAGIPPIVLAGITPTILPGGTFHISCNGGSDGIINASASGGAGPFTYSIDGVSFSSDSLFDSLVAGPYTITYKDANGCTDTESFTLLDPMVLSWSIGLPQAASCFGIPDGEINFPAPGGGVTPYQYSIDSGQNYQNSSYFQSLLGDSIYEAMIEDAHGCQETALVFVSQPTEIFFSTTLSDYNGFEVSCFLASDGTIDFGTPSGGSGAGYTYSIDAGATGYTLSPSYSNSPAGPYILSVKDGNGCKKDTNVILTSPSQFLISPVVTSNYNGSQISCNGVSDGIITVTQVNGVSPINYGLNDGAFSANTSWDFLPAGTDTVYAEDANGCLDSAIIIIIQPLALTATTDSTEEFCNQTDGMAEVFSSGGTGAPSFSWNDPSNIQSSQATGLDAGTYSCLITDINNCSITETVIVADSIPFVLSFTTTPACPNLSTGSATVNVTPLVGSYTYSWECTHHSNCR
jgi:plastocyanin